MTNEKRIEALEEAAMASMTESLVSDCLLRALIATHPNPDRLEVAFQALLAAQETQLADTGFEKGRPPHHTQDVRELIRAQAAKWLALFPPRQGGG